MRRGFSYDLIASRVRAANENNSEVE